MNSGIYKISSPSGRLYIGSAVDFKKRNRQHFWHLRRNTHHSPALQNAFNKYGEQNLKFEILLICKSKDLLFYEQRAIDALKPEYNICRSAGSCLGIKRTAEQNAAKSKLLKGKKTGLRLTPEKRARVLANLHSAEARAKALPKLRDPEFKARQSEQFSKPIKCIENGLIFPSMQAAGQWCFEQALTTNKRAFVPISKSISRAGTAFGLTWITIEKDIK